MVLLEKAGNHSEIVIEAALKRAIEDNLDIVASSSSGKTAQYLKEKAIEIGYQGNLVIVTTASTAAASGINRFDAKLRKELEASGVKVVTCAHALSAGERGISARHKGISPLEIMADTLRTFGAGTKVCFECAVMALDCDALGFGKPVISLGGTSRGLDTALIITPSYSSTILDTVIHEIIIKPFDISRPK